MKKTLAMLLAAALFTAGLTGCGSGKSTDKQSTPSQSSSAAANMSNNSLTVCVGPEPDTIDPALNKTADTSTMLVHVFEGLYALDSNSTAQPAQATGCTISEDGLTYTFHLRENLKWSDGSALTADDYVYSWQRAVDPLTAADYAYLFGCISGFKEASDGDEPDPTRLQVSAPDEKTLVVSLVSPTAYFLDLVAFPTFMPVQKATVEANGEAWTGDPATYVSNGPFKLSKWTHKSEIVLEKNPNYWNADQIKLDKLTFALIQDPAAQLAAYQNGEIAFADNIPNDEVEAWKDKPDFYLIDQNGTYYVSYNVTKAPFDQPLIRQALTLAIDRDFICTNIGKTGQSPAGAYVPPILNDVDDTNKFREVGGSYFDPTAGANNANLEKAKELLVQAGYPNGEGLPSIEYVYNNNDDQHLQVGEALKDMWGKIGINIDLVGQEWNVFLNTRKNGDYHVARDGWVGDYNDPMTFLDMWTSGGGNNNAQWADPNYDKLIEEIQVTADAQKRFELLHQAEKMLFDAWILCPIWFNSDYYLLSPNVENVFSSPLGYKFFMYASVK